MKLQELVDSLSLVVKTASANLTKEVTGGYVSDLLSDVMANTKEEIYVSIDSWRKARLKVHYQIVKKLMLESYYTLEMASARVYKEIENGQHNAEIFAEARRAK